eukprot:225884-Rhodomonas_salina.1
MSVPDIAQQHTLLQYRKSHSSIHYVSTGQRVTAYAMQHWPGRSIIRELSTAHRVAQTRAQYCTSRSAIRELSAAHRVAQYALSQSVPHTS